MSEPGRPQLRVVRGEPTAEELAVLAAVVTAAAARRPARRAPGQQRGRWADPFDMHRRPWQTGVGGWRAAVR
jgi:hypothetical protein